MNDKHIAVLLIDMQKYFVAKLRPGSHRRMINQQVKVIEACIRFDIPLFIIEVSPERLGKTIAKLLRKVRRVPRSYFISKKHSSAFYNPTPDIEHLLQELEIKKLVVMGINADYCVKETAEDALKRGFEIISAADLISGQDHHSPDNSRDWYEANGTFAESANALLPILQEA